MQQRDVEWVREFLGVPPPEGSCWVPLPALGDASVAVRRGARRRRWRPGGRVAVALVVVGALAVGATSLLDRPAQLDIADQPPASVPALTEGQDGRSTPIDEPVITRAPALTVSSREPFAWVVAVSAGDGGRWCVTTARGTTEITDQVGQPCDQELHLESSGVSMQGVDGNASTEAGAGRQQLAWGSAPADTDHVVVELTDGTRWGARRASGDAVDATLWAIGYEQGEVHAVEAQGESWSVGTVALEDGWTVADMLLVLGGLAAILVVVAAARWLILRRDT